MSVDRYVKKPIQVEAMQLTRPTDIEQAGEWINTNGGSASWVATTTKSQYTQSQDWLTVHTGEGPQTAFLGDWVVLGQTGGFWTMRGDIFEKVYRPANEENHGTR